MLAEYPGLDKNYRLIEFKTRNNQEYFAFSNTYWFWVLRFYSSDCDCCLQLTKEDNKPFIRQGFWALIKNIKDIDGKTIQNSRFHCCDNCLASMEFEGITMHKIALAKRLKGVP